MTNHAQTALLDELDSLLTRGRQIAGQLRTITAPDSSTADGDEALLSSLDSVQMPDFDKATAVQWQDLRTAYVLQSFNNLGHPADQTEAAAIVRRAGYPTGSGANVLYRHGWLIADVDANGRSHNRQVSDKGRTWLETTGRKALLAYLRSS